MNISLLLISIISSFICIFLLLKLFLIKKSIIEIEKNFTKILESDTNNIISISSSDKDIKNLTINLNDNLIELRKQKLKYKNGNQELKKIVTNISHDLRTPLTALKGYIDLINKEKLSISQKKYLKIIQKKSDELNELTGQLFEFSKIIDTLEKNINLSKDECCINEILEETLLSFYNIFKEKNIFPTINISNKKLYKKVNKISIVRIFENILSNVSKYSNGDFEVEMDDNGIITFSNKANSLDATSVQKIFDRYFSVENAKESTGIGLSIAKQLVEMNDGEIYAEYSRERLYIKINFR
ncbi:MAG: HAMP domain-containing sensor histidine kinase [Clostridia bacterium]|uniref:sensor histidine kinase n=1 Tax=Candidatus Merdicola sp. TaxID=3085652 RepID=UPI002EA84182|nr:HAMP domain-containing sensor histidine kinase [Clostridia bacterium]